MRSLGQGARHPRENRGLGSGPGPLLRVCCAIEPRLSCELGRKPNVEKACGGSFILNALVGMEGLQASMENGELF